MSKNKTPIAFLAHNSPDKPQVRIIADRPNKKGIETWLDEEQIPPGVSFQDRLQKAIAEIDCALIFIGKNGLGRWQNWELKSFFSKLVNDSIPIIPVLLPGVETIPDDLIFLRELNWVEFTDDLADSATIDNLVWGITGKRTHIDYSTLETQLSAGLWREANFETRRIILQSCNREEDGYLIEAEIRSFDSAILLTLDRLWLKYSNDRFGFSVQKKILIDCQKDLHKFGMQVGWRQADRWIDEPSFIYSLDAPIGHLPCKIMGIFEINDRLIETLLDTQFKISKALSDRELFKQFISDAAAWGSLDPYPTQSIHPILEILADREISIPPYANSKNLEIANSYLSKFGSQPK
jgi:hypothetical protein